MAYLVTMNEPANHEESPTPASLDPAPVFVAPGPSRSEVFFGPNGLRAGWRLLCYIAMIAAVAASMNFILHRLIHHKLPEMWGNCIGELIGLTAAFIPAIIMARVEKRRFGAYGLPAQSTFGRMFAIGLLWGFAAQTVLLLAIAGVGDFSISGLALHGIRILKYGLFWGVFFLAVGFFEEFLTRGYTQFTLTQGIGFWPAAILLSLAFGGLHLGNPGENKVGIVAVVAIALFFCLTLYRTGTLWFAVGFHAAWDWAESYFYSVPDSGSLSPGHLLNSTFTGSRWVTGGSDGPEGSTFVLALIVLLCAVFNRVYPKTNYQA